MSTETYTHMNVQTRNQYIAEDFHQLSLKEPQPSLRAMFQWVSQKYKISPSNAKQIYYAIYKKRNMLSNKDTQPIQEKPYEQAAYIETIFLGTAHIRLFSWKEERYAVAKDILRACGIQSQSSYFHAVTNEDNQITMPILSSRGVKRMRLVRIDACLQFAETVAKEHLFITIKNQANALYAKLIAYTLTIGYSTTEKENSTADTVHTHEPTDVSSAQEETVASYTIGEEIDFTVTSIGSKCVTGLTNDDFQTPVTIYISDVTDKYIRNLRHYFTTGETIRATVKYYDKGRQKLSLTTRASQIEALTKKRDDSRVKETDTVLAINKETTHKSLSAILPQETKETKIEDAFSLNTHETLSSIVSMIVNEGRIGALTPEAKRKLVSLLNEQGIVSVISSIKDTFSMFKPDLGLAFLHSVEKNIKKDCL